jgi:hypothetical protein
MSRAFEPKACPEPGTECAPPAPIAQSYSIEYNAPVFIVKRMPQFDLWLAGLRDTMTRIRLARRLDKVQRGLLGAGGRRRV